ncbi:hypothetical protein FBU30_009326 [Linnemannia zychae]|nr:hypothetical protein FBU30_009326 [Linnemannia zychae]
MATHPLEVPEILTRIGEYLPLWVEQDDPLVDLDNLADDKDIVFDPHVLLSCMQVSKLWYQTLLPVLWYSYDGFKMSGISQETITRYSYYFRDFRSLGGHAGPFRSSHLVELTIYMQMQRPTISLQSQKDLVKANPRLRYLEWHGPEMITDLDAEDFIGLKCLQDLHLFRWNGGERKLARVLQAVAGTLRAFEVSRIKNVLPGDLVSALHELDDNKNKQIILSDDTARGDKCSGLILPNLEKLKVMFDKNPDYVELAQCCPNLKRLTVTGLGPVKIDRLSYCLQNHCQRLNVLVLKDVLLSQEDAIDLLQSTLSAGGLVKIHLDVIGFEHDMISAILLHAPTLEKLTISSTAEDNVDIRGIMRILVECEKLKQLRLMLDTSLSDLDVLSYWKSQKWGCTQLERLGLELNYCEDFNDDEDIEDEDDTDYNEYDTEERKDDMDQSLENVDDEEDDMAAFRQDSRMGPTLRSGSFLGSVKTSKSSSLITISSKVPYMGWYRHPQGTHDFSSSKWEKMDTTALRILFEMFNTPTPIVKLSARISINMIHCKSPLELPEIITLIGSFLSPWPDWPFTYKFEPHDLQTCLLVCKTWQKALLPVLWSAYSGFEMQHVPGSIISRYCHYFRHLYSSIMHSELLACTQLETIELSFRSNIDQATLKHLLQNNNQLRRLFLVGCDNLLTLNSKDFTKLSNLQDLVIYGWDKLDGEIFRILSTISPSIKNIKLSISAPRQMESLSQSTSLTTSQSYSDVFKSDDHHLAFPCLESVGIRFSNEVDLEHAYQIKAYHFQRIFAECPQLKNLHIDIPLAGDFSSLAATLHHGSPLLRKMILSDNYHDGDENRLAQLVRNCTVMGLAHLEIRGIGITLKPQLVDSILTHASTLTRLHIVTKDQLKNEGILQLLVRGLKLKSLVLQCEGAAGDYETISTLASQPWHCKELEFLDFDFPLMFDMDDITRVMGEREIYDNDPEMEWVQLVDFTRQTQTWQVVGTSQMLRHYLGMVRELRKLKVIRLGSEAFGRRCAIAAIRG